MFSIGPFRKKKRYFVRTLTFYYLCTFVQRRGKFYKFVDVEWIKNIPDYDDFIKSKPRLPPAMQPVQVGVIWIHEDAVVDLCDWQ